MVLYRQSGACYGKHKMSGTAESFSVSWSHAAVGRFFVSRREYKSQNQKEKRSKQEYGKGLYLNLEFARNLL